MPDYSISHLLLTRWLAALLLPALLVLADSSAASAETVLEDRASILSQIQARGDLLDGLTLDVAQAMLEIVFLARTL